MVIVPKGKTICYGQRKFVEGDILPPHVEINFNNQEPEIPVYADYVEDVADNFIEEVKLPKEIIKEHDIEDVNLFKGKTTKKRGRPRRKKEFE
jgi:hypothetical protein